MQNLWASDYNLLQAEEVVRPVLAGATELGDAAAVERLNGCADDTDQLHYNGLSANVCVAYKGDGAGDCGVNCVFGIGRIYVDLERHYGFKIDVEKY